MDSKTNEQVAEKLKSFVPRIIQLDAVVFDTEIHGLLTTQLLEVSRFLKPGFLSSIKPEVKLLIHLLIYKYSLLKVNATFGQQLLGVEYQSKFKKQTALGFAFLQYVLPYMRERHQDSFTSITHNSVKYLIDKLELMFKASQFINSLYFLRSGVYPTIIDRILGLKYRPVGSLNRSVGYSYMTRELLWHGFMELLMFSLPLINYQAVKRHMRNLMYFANNSSEEQKGVMYDLNTMCSVCQNTPTIPCRVSLFCSHVACYYCIKSNIDADEKFQCTVCGAMNTAHDNLQLL